MSKTRRDDREFRRKETRRNPGSKKLAKRAVRQAAKKSR